MILGDWSCIHVYMDIQSIFTIVLEVLKAGVKLMALWLSYRLAFTHNILQLMSKTEPLDKEIKDYAWQYERSEDGTREIHGVQHGHYVAGLKKTWRCQQRKLEAVAKHGHYFVDNHGAKIAIYAAILCLFICYLAVSISLSLSLVLVCTHTRTHNSLNCPTSVCPHLSIHPDSTYPPSWLYLSTTTSTLRPDTRAAALPLC